MGRYMRKAKLSEDVAVMEVSQTLGVRTRAKTLALQRLQSSNVPDSSCYLQLRSRRLVKPSTLNSEANRINSRQENWQQESEVKCGPSSSSRLRVANSVNSASGDSGSINRINVEEGCFVSRVAGGTGNECDFGVEASFGENNLDFEPQERSTRESTPCSLKTPGSSTRQSAVITNVPSTAEIEEFFAPTEQQQQRQFIDKYNFDIANDVPITGRYEWVRVNY